MTPTSSRTFLVEGETALGLVTTSATVSKKTSACANTPVASTLVGFAAVTT